MQSPIRYNLPSDEDALAVPDAPQGFRDGQRGLNYLWDRHPTKDFQTVLFKPL